MIPTSQDRALIVGVDLVCVADVSDAIARFGRRYVERVFTPGEIAYASGNEPAAAQRFAARFAAKEAALKVLRPDPSEAISWQTIEVRRAPQGWCDIVLRGAARELADRQGVEGMSLSMSHERDYVVATVVAHRAIHASKGCAEDESPSVRRLNEETDQSRGDRAVEELIRAIVREHGRLSVDVADLSSEASLYQAGLTSHASVNLMLALEDQFGIEFPERLLRRRTFETIGGIASAVAELKGDSISAA